MSVPTTTPDIEYSETDGQPMGETAWHVAWIFRLYDLLTRRYRDQRVLVASDMFVYYEEGIPWRKFAADAMVVKDCDPYPRRVFKIWDEGRVPSAVFELVSRGTKRDDLEFKPGLYERLGIGEYFLYDPLGEEIRPQLQGFRLTPAGYEPIRPDSAGRLHSTELGLWLRVEDSDLVLYDTATGEKLCTGEEAEHKALEAERAAREAERAAREAERAAREAAEAELHRLRDQLRRHGLSD
jgi:Uma2 family endonuclease